MFISGVVSVSFRPNSVEEIINAAKNANLSLIEWGSDVHSPAGDTLLAEKISKLRIFSDENGKMNLSVKDVSGKALIVSNFTLNANYSHGNRPDYFNSAPPAEAEQLYEYFKAELQKRDIFCASGVFGADMRTEMSTDGPVTIVMDSKVLLGGKI